MDSVEAKFVLQVPSSTRNLAVIRDFVSNLGEQAGLEENEVVRLQLAVDEACSNVMEHAYGHDSTKEVVIRAHFDEESLEIEVLDTGFSFDPETINQKNLEELIAERKKGGLGLRLIQSLMDEVYYEIAPGQKNQLRMVKKLHKKK